MRRGWICDACGRGVEIQPWKCPGCGREVCENCFDQYAHCKTCAASKTPNDMELAAIQAGLIQEG